MNERLAAPPEMQDALAAIERIGGPALVERIAGMFETSARQRLQALDACVADGDRRPLARVAHAMKGSAAQVGATRARDLAASLEANAESLDLEQLRDAVAALKAECWNACALLGVHAARGADA